MMLIRFGCVLLLACGKVVEGAAADAAQMPVTDAGGPRDAVAICGDGHRDPGEVCFGAPITITGKDLVYDAHLADIDGDGDLDLVYLIGNQLVFHLQDRGQFAAAGLDGPTVTGTHAMALKLNTSAAAALVVAGTPALNAYVRTDQGAYTQVATIATASDSTALAAGKITGGALPDIATIYGSAIHVARFDANLSLVEVSSTAISGADDLAVGELTGDTFADVVVAGRPGVMLLRGGVSGLGAINDTPQTEPTDAVALGDIDGDHKLDIAFVVAGTPGQLGAMVAVGGGGFLAPTLIAVDSISHTLETTDLDGDGHADVIAVRKQTGNFAVLVSLGRADGTLAAPVVLPVPIAPDYLRVDADFNGDGINDIVITDTHRQMVIILPSSP